MELKNFQKQVISDLNRYCELLNSTNSVVKAYNDYWLEKGVRVGFDAIPTKIRLKTRHTFVSKCLRVVAKPFWRAIR